MNKKIYTEPSMAIFQVNPCLLLSMSFSEEEANPNVGAGAKRRSLDSFDDEDGEEL